MESLIEEGHSNKIQEMEPGECYDVTILSGGHSIATSSVAPCDGSGASIVEAALQPCWLEAMLHCCATHIPFTHSVRRHQVASQTPQGALLAWWGHCPR